MFRRGLHNVMIMIKEERYCETPAFRLLNLRGPPSSLCYGIDDLFPGKPHGDININHQGKLKENQLL